MIILLYILIVILLGIVALLMTEIHRITKELTFINAHETNGYVTSNTALPIIKHLVTASNHSLKVSRDLQQHQAQQEAEVQRMLTNLTHDIKTPLTVSMGYVQLLSKDVSTQHQPQLQRISRNLESVNYYLRYLMDFNLMQEKSTTLTVKPVNVSQLLENELFDYYDELTKQQLVVTPDIAPDVTIPTDATLLTRVFQNLIGNILKYASGQVAVSLSQVDGSHYHLVFANQGKHLPEHPDELLNRFYTADESRTNQSVGLGFSIVQSLVTTLGGRLQLATEDDWFKVTVVLKPLQEIKK